MKEDYKNCLIFLYASIQNSKKYTGEANINGYKEYILHLWFH